MSVTEENLSLLEQHTNRRYAIVKDGVATMVADNTVIPVAHIAYQTMPEDGMYYVSIANCGLQDCSVGIPKPKCVRQGIYSVRKCAVYYLESDIESARITIAEALAMVRGES